VHEDLPVGARACKRSLGEGKDGRKKDFFFEKKKQKTFAN
jgi:hypothetical protein